MTAIRRPEHLDHSRNAATPEADTEHVGGDLLVAAAFLATFLVVCLFTLASFMVGLFGR